MKAFASHRRQQQLRAACVLCMHMEDEGFSDSSYGDHSFNNDAGIVRTSDGDGRYGGFALAHSRTDDDVLWSEDSDDWTFDDDFAVLVSAYFTEVDMGSFNYCMVCTIDFNNRNGIRIATSQQSFDSTAMAWGSASSAGNAFGTEDINTAQWYDFKFERIGSTLANTHDGVEQQTTSNGDTYNPTTANTRMISIANRINTDDDSSGTEGFDGRIDEVVFFKKVVPGPHCGPRANAFAV